MKKFVVAASMLLAVVVNADTCQWEQVCDGESNCHYEHVCYPDYYVWQYTQPNWCLYDVGDEVAVQYNAQLHIVAWYVTPASDPGRDGDFVVISGCRLFQYPF